nr:fumagillin dodecapentaenoate synthase [Quercus suber]
MGNALIEHFPQAMALFAELDDVLQQLPDAPSWSIVDEISQSRPAEHLRQPEFSQPLTTALQLVIHDIYKQWGVDADVAVGHSSGEFAAAYASGLISKATAIKAAYYCGWAAKSCQGNSESPVGMLSVATEAETIKSYLDNAEGDVTIACFNGPRALALSGTVPALTKIKEQLVQAGHYATFIHADLAYHSRFMNDICETFESRLKANTSATPTTNPTASMYSTVTGELMSGAADAAYWTKNLLSPVLFEQTISTMLNSPNAPNVLIEIGPAGVLAGPVTEIKTRLGGAAEGVQYLRSLNRGPSAISPILHTAGKLFMAGHDVNLARVNEPRSGPESLTTIDLPNNPESESKA